MAQRPDTGERLMLELDRLAGWLGLKRTPIGAIVRRREMADLPVSR